jgi:hypothetical protein
MKRDMDLFRLLLLKAEDQPFGGALPQIEIPDHTPEEVYYHALLAKGAGFVEASRGPGPGWTAAAHRLFCAPCADTACGGALQHPCVPPDDGPRQYRSRAGRLRVVDSGLPSVPRKLQGYFHCEACDAEAPRTIFVVCPPQHTKIIPRLYIH